MNRVNGICTLLKEISTRLSSDQQRSTQILGGADSLLHLLLRGISQDKRFPNSILLVLPHQKDLFAWEEVLERILYRSSIPVEICTLPYYLVWGPEKYSNHVLLRQEKLMCLHKVLKEKNTKKIILTTLPALAQFTLSEDKFLSSYLEIHDGDTLDPEIFVQKIETLGYQSTYKVEEKGHYSLRGGLLDIFPIQEDSPIRIEFIGDQVSSLRFFSPETQRSSDNLTTTTIVPCAELILGSAEQLEKTQFLYNFLLEENVEQLELKALMASYENKERAPILDALTFTLLDEKQPLVDFFSDCLAIYPHAFEKCLQSLKDFNEDVHKLYLKDKELNHAATHPTNVFVSKEELLEKFKDIPFVEFGNPVQREEAFPVLWKSSSTVKVPKEKEAVKEWVAYFRSSLNEAESTIVMCESSEQVEQAKAFFQKNFKEAANFDTNPFQMIFQGAMKRGQIHITYGSLPDLIMDEEQNVLLLPFRKMFGGRSRSSVPANRKLKNLLSSFRDLEVDNLIVHIDHGIGRYKGMTQLDLQGYKGDFLVLEYKNNDKIYLPVDRLNLLQKYKKDEGGRLPHLDKLGSNSFVERKARVLKAIENIAEDLIKVHAERKMLRGHAFSAPGEIYESFCNDFAYQETPDQLRCLDDLEVDFQGAHPMDRIVVGDVGFGKTEVALRAALRAILEGFQVMFLVPTTVLCYQHYYNFTFRMEKYGIKIGQIHRLVKASVQKKTLEGFQQGKVDMLVGTHRILSKDVHPKNLGLLIVDEEQRFGVVQKERFKKLKANIDILTLSATPIPRTLHMALLGLRDMSLIVTPPANRMPVRTIVSPFDERLIKGAIESEILRGGQVFYVHNRVGNLSEIGSALAKLVPHAKIRTAHGQMHENSLDSIIIDFLEQKFNVLVCTTIIESGVDMPNVNTLIVENSEKFGLAQLHQLRGRVGRSSIQAYAYLLTRNVESVSDDAMKRLELLISHQELGSGFQLANYDLELRGAGNLIGKQQSGQIASVGLELYVDMLDEKIKELSSIKSDRKLDPEIRIKVTAIIPSWYVSEDKERLDIYKRFFSANAVDEIYDLQQSTEDRFGKTPTEFNTLVKIALLRLHLRLLGAEAIVELTKSTYEIRIPGTKNNQQIRLENLMAEDSDEIRVDKLLDKIENIAKRDI